MRRVPVVFCAVVLLLAVVAQVAVVNRLGLPFGVVPDLALLVVVALALLTGARSGAVLGFAAGLAADLMPAAAGPLGLSALVLCLVGYATGRVGALAVRSPVMPFAVTAAATLAAGVLYALLGALLGDPRIGFGSVLHVVPWTWLCTLLLSPFALFLIFTGYRRVTGGDTAMGW
ncbi:rod shape-determining protein MreD [Allonocardiopsis opalescens]|uniref:Rod shape-determining protein MreD n=1 Tax=Allonocardiopsis opalescens TaxID=1144618 RepID=A0A2T0PXW9_9ACTN|nr:rod shape-determining protein MreD [Allonocardiopsis opalescens]PRX96367.1 rod shape-determining protein MreD [Allonocardiopsis opalescens]